MKSDAGRLHMASLELDTRVLFRMSRRLGLPTRQDDLGYLAHCYLTALFDDLAPRPFRVSGGDSQGRSRILGYTTYDAETLEARSRTYADPDLYAACDWESLATKQMPEEWPTGARFGFEIRACPVIRKSAAGERHKEGAEVDAFLSACWAVGSDEGVERESVYRVWLAERLERAANVLKCGLRRFRLARLVRRRQGGKRTSSLLQRPDAILAGELEIEEGEEFANLLAGGVGRHKAFGFGMLMLRPDGPPRC